MKIEDSLNCFKTETDAYSGRAPPRFWGLEKNWDDTIHCLLLEERLTLINYGCCHNLNMFKTLAVLITYQYFIVWLTAPVAPQIGHLYFHKTEKKNVWDLIIQCVFEEHLTLINYIPGHLTYPASSLRVWFK